MGEKKEIDGDQAPKEQPEKPSAELDQRKLFKEGQRFITPPVADATRGFYESLYAENPESKIAIRFCVEYGLLSLEDHKKVLKKFNHLKEKGAYDARIAIKRTLEKASRKEAKEGKERDEGK